MIVLIKKKLFINFYIIYNLSIKWAYHKACWILANITTTETIQQWKSSSKSPWKTPKEASTLTTEPISWIMVKGNSDIIVRLMLARNWDDFLQRDLKAYTFPRASAVLFLNSCVFFTVFTWVRHLLPVGRFGIRRVSQTQFYQNFGVPGVAGAGLLLFAALYSEIKTIKFFLHKLYRHVIMQDRNWIHEG